MSSNSLKIIIIGASSGIGKALALQYAKQNHQVAISGRRLDKLKEVQQQYPNKILVNQMDVCKPEHTGIQFDNMVDKLGGVDLVIYNAGVGHLNKKLNWQKEISTIQTNVEGFTLIAGKAYNHFAKQKHGQFVNISSINALRGSNVAPAYAASKAYSSNYMQGLRKKAYKANLPIILTDILPGFVNTDMAQGTGLFWVAPVDKAAKQIINAISKKRNVAYITKRWRLIGWLLKILPEWVY